jgi:WD40 repeat protein
VKVPGDEDRYGRSHIDQAHVSPDASLLVLGLRRFFVFDIATGRELRTLDLEGGVLALTISPDRRRLVTGSRGKAAQTMLPDGSILNSASKTHSVTLRDFGSGQIDRQFTVTAQGLGPLAFSTDGQRFAVAMTQPQHKIAIYDTASGLQQFVIDNVPHRIASLAFAPDGRTLVSGLADSTALVWALK